MANEYTLITGSTGFIGSHVLGKLLAEGFHVLAVVRDLNIRKKLEESGLRGAIFVEGRFYDEAILSALFTKYQISNVIHIAAVRGAGKAASNDYHMVNVHGTEVLLEHAHRYGVKRFIHCSSVGVYGTIPAELPASVTTAYHGDNNYHRSKIQAELKVMEYIGRGLDAYIVRPTIAYGPGDNGFPSTFAALVRKRMLLLPRRENRIHLVDVEKLSDIFINMLTSDKKLDRIFIAADASAISCRDLADTIHECYYDKPYPSYLTLPDFIYDLATQLIFFLRYDKWLVRILLISKSWYFDNADTTAKLEVIPTETKEGFRLFIADLKLRSHGQ
jgi:nucleoside-diphosphate-sugar epimerase